MDAPRSMTKPRHATTTALSLREITRRFSAGDRVVTVLESMNLNVEPGERVAILGASGSGKSTLLSLAAGMDQPDDGQVEVLGRDLGAIGEPELTRFRARQVGLVFQDYNLIDSLSARENIALPLWLNGMRTDSPHLDELSQALGIADLLERMPDQLSGGEKQRVAIARALVHGPALLLADEPTGSLDETSSGRVLELFDRVTADRGCALILVTHNPEAAAICTRRLKLHGGKLQTA